MRREYKPLVKIHEFKNGMTIAELKQLVIDLPEVDENGDPGTVWFGDPDEHRSSLVTIVSRLNQVDLLLDC